MSGADGSSNVKPTRSQWIRFVAVIGIAWALAGCRSRTPPTNVDTDDPAATAEAPPVRDSPLATIGSGAPAVYLERVPLAGQAPAIRPFAAVAVPPADAAARPGRVVVSGWKRGTREPLLQLVDIDEARVLWSVADSCRGAVLSATRERAICSSAGAIDGIDLRTGHRVWAAQLEHVASGQGVVVARDARGVSLLSTETGALLVRLRTGAADQGAGAGSLRRVCADPESGQVTLLGWDQAGRVVARDVDMRTGETLVRWTATLSGAVVDDDVCRGRTAAFAVRSANQTTAVRLSLVDGREITRFAAEAGRELGPPGLGVLQPGPDEVRELVDGRGRRAVLAAPVGVKQIYPGEVHLLAVGRLDEASAAGEIGVYRLPELGPPQRRPPAPKAETATPTEVPAARAFAAAVSLPNSSGFVPAAVSLASDVLWIAGAGEVVSFDLKAGSFGVRDRELCTARARPIAVVASGAAYACGTRENDPGRGFVRGRAGAGMPAWTARFSTLDRLSVEAGHYVAVAGPTAVVIRPDTGESVYRVAADNAHSPRFAALGDLIVHVEPGRLVARDPNDGGAPRWSVAFTGYPVVVATVGERVIVVFRDRSVASVGLDGAVQQTPPPSGRVLGAAGSLWLDEVSAVDARGEPVLSVRGRLATGEVRFRATMNVQPGFAVLAHRSSGEGAPVVIEDRNGAERLVVVDAGDGRVLGAIRLSRTRKQGTAFATQRVVGAVSSNPLTVHTTPVPDFERGRPDGTTATEGALRPRPGPASR